jgi:excisionase family DNA binding protein
MVTDREANLAIGSAHATTRHLPAEGSRAAFGFDDDRWVRVREAARVAGVDPRTIRRWADTGRIPARVTPGGQRQISLAGLGASYSPGRRAVERDPLAVDPDVAVPEWSATCALWHIWRPPRRLSDDDIATLRSDVRHLEAALRDLESTLTEELQDRDRRAAGEP